MKKAIIILVSVFLGLIIAAASLYYVGNMPEKTYYPDGKIKSITEKKFFKKNGRYTLFNQNGAISQKYTLVNGVKNATAYIYTTGRPTEFTYNNGVLVGPVVIDKGKLSDDVEALDISIKPQNAIEIKLKTKEGEINSQGKLMCKDEDFINKFQQFDLSLNPQTVKDFFNCLSFTKTNISAKDLNCTFEGEYQYPKFKADTKFICEKIPLDMESIGYEEQIKTDVFYDVKKEALNIQTYSNDSQYVLNSSFKGIEKLIENVVDFSSSSQSDEEKGKLLSAIIENFTTSDMEFVIGNQKISTVEGDFNIMKGFSNPYIISYYTKQDATTKIQINDKGISLKSRYPLSKKPMIGIEINVNDVIKEKYTQLIKGLTEELSKNINVPQAALFGVMSQWTDYAWQFSDVVKSVGGAVWNNKGQKVLAVVATVRNNINIETFFEDMSKYVDIKIITFKDGKPKEVAIGNLAEGFAINGKPATLDDIHKMLLNSEIENTIKEMEEEFNKAFADVNMDIHNGTITAVDPFLFGFYSGYTSAMEKYKQSKASEQFSNMISNIKVLFSEAENYNGLENKTVVMFMPSDMVKDMQTGVIENAFEGNVTIKASKLFANDEDNKAYIVEFDGLDKQTCINLASTSILYNPLAVAVGNQQSSGTVDAFGLVGTIVEPVYKDSKDTSVITQDGVAFSINQGIPFSYAMAACNGEGNTNAIAIKVH